MLPTLDKTLDDVTPLIATLIEQYGDFVREAIKAIPAAVGNLFQQSGTGQGSDIFGVRYDPGAYRPGGNAQSTKEYWNEVARQALKKAGEIKGASSKKQISFSTPVPPRESLPAPSSQLGIIEKARTVKRKAGQSQILERIKLIKEINYSATVKLPRISIKLKPGMRKYIASLQQRLVNLLDRYDFSKDVSA